MVEAVETRIPLVEAVGLSKSYLGVQAVKDLDLEILPGECVGLVGKNGAGKSTFIKMLAGLVTPDRGRFQVDGVQVSLASPRDARRSRLAFVHQNLNDIPSLSVADNVWLGYPLPRGRLGRIDRTAARREASHWLSAVGSAVAPEERMGALPVAERQLVMLARALSQGARLVVMDEPTATLSTREVEQLRGVLQRLHEQQVSVLFVSHRLSEVLEFCDRVVVMRDGERVAQRPTAGLREPDLVELITGRPNPVEHRRDGGPVRRSESEPLLRVRELRCADGASMSFDLHRGEVLGLAGLVGSGRTEVARAVAGIDPRRGSVRVNDVEVRPGSVRAAIDAGITLVPEDRLTNGFVPGFSVRENLTLPSLSRFRRRRLVPMTSRRHEEEAGREMVDRLSIACSGLTQHVDRLSGGNQQKVVLGKWLIHGADVVLLDEPTDGVDAEAREGIYQEIRQLAREGRGVLLISAEFSELARLCDRALVLSNGTVQGELVGAEVNEVEMVRLCYLSETPAPEGEAV